MSRPRRPDPARPAGHRRAPGPHPDRGTVKVVGLEACRALFAKRPHDLRRVFLLRPLLAALGDVLRWCAAAHIPYRVVELEELTRVAETTHHDGVCFVAQPRAPGEKSALFAYIKERPTGPLALVLVDGLKNPNNVGAVARSAAYFGVPFLLGAGGSIGLTAAALRTSQGGGELLDFVNLDAGGLRELAAAGFALVATSSHATTSLVATALPARCVLMLGGENAGLSKELEALAKVRVAVPGVGALESLNVATAAALLLWEHFRTHRAHDSRPAPGATSAPRRSESTKSS